MDVTQIPFARYVGIEKKEESRLKLEATQVVKNHIQTIHASAQFALAETQSGLLLQLEFPELVGKVTGLLRSSSVKYKNPASTSIYAIASIEEDVKEKFLRQLEKKGRALISINTLLKDENDIVVMSGIFDWYIHKI